MEHAAHMQYESIAYSKSDVIKQQKYLDRAQEALKLAYQYSENADNIDSDLLAQVYSRIGWFLKYNNRTIEGISWQELITTAMDMKPNDPVIIYQYAMTLDDESRKVELFEKALNIKPEFPEVELDLMSFYLGQRNYEKADELREDFRDSLPHFSPSLINFDDSYPSPLAHIFIDASKGSVQRVLYRPDLERFDIASSK